VALSLFKSIKLHRLASKKLSKLLEFAISSPEVMDAMIELAEKTSKDAVLQKILDETETKDIDAGLIRKLMESAQSGVVVDIKMQNATVTLRKEDVYDDMARQRFNRMVQEKSNPMGTIAFPNELQG